MEGDCRRHAHVGFLLNGCLISCVPAAAGLRVWIASSAFLGELGLSLHKGKDGPTPKDYQALLASIKDRPDYHVIQTVMLRSPARR